MNIETFSRRIANRLGYSLQPKKKTDPDTLALRHFLELALSFKPEATFIEIGANDGITNDPIYALVKERNLIGTVVEPQADVFEILKANYAGTQIKCVNAAVATESGGKVFYTVKESVKNKDNFKRVTGIATFDKRTLLHTITNKIPKGADPENYIEETLVPCVTLKELGSADIYQIDCEGYDYEVVKQIDFSKKPIIVNFESGHLTESQMSELNALFIHHGYSWFNHGIDTCAYPTHKNSI